MDRDERIEGIAGSIAAESMQDPAKVSTLWADTVNADGLGLSGDEVAAFLLGSGSIVRRGIAVLRLIEDRIGKAAFAEAVDEATCIVDQPKRRMPHGERDEEADDLS